MPPPLLDQLVIGSVHIVPGADFSKENISSGSNLPKLSLDVIYCVLENILNISMKTFAHLGAEILENVKIIIIITVNAGK